MIFLFLITLLKRYTLLDIDLMHCVLFFTVVVKIVPGNGTNERNTESDLPNNWSDEAKRYMLTGEKIVYLLYCLQFFILHKLV